MGVKADIQRLGSIVIQIKPSMTNDAVILAKTHHHHRQIIVHMEIACQVTKKRTSFFKFQTLNTVQYLVVFRNNLDKAFNNAAIAATVKLTLWIKI